MPRIPFVRVMLLPCTADPFGGHHNSNYSLSGAWLNSCHTFCGNATTFVALDLPRIERGSARRSRIDSISGPGSSNKVPPLHGSQFDGFMYFKFSCEILCPLRTKDSVPDVSAAKRITDNPELFVLLPVATKAICCCRVDHWFFLLCWRISLAPAGRSIGVTFPPPSTGATNSFWKRIRFLLRCWLHVRYCSIHF